jgi:hypothetical protein
MQQIPADIIRYWSSFSNLTVREILQRCRVNRQLLNAICGSRTFWEGLFRQRLTENPAATKELDVKGMQTQLHMLDELYRKLEKTNQRAKIQLIFLHDYSDSIYILETLRSIAYNEYEKAIEKFLEIDHPRAYFSYYLYALLTGAIQGNHEELLQRLVEIAEDSEIHLGVSQLLSAAAEKGRSDLIELFLAGNAFREVYARTILDNGISYLARNPNDKRFRDYLAGMLQSYPYLQDDAFVIALVRDYPDFVERYRDTVDRRYLSDVAVASLVEYSTDEDIQLVHKIIDILPVNANLALIFPHAIDTDRVEIVEHLVEKMEGNTNLLQDIIQDWSKYHPDQQLSPAMSKLLSPYM